MEKIFRWFGLILTIILVGCGKNESESPYITETKYALTIEQINRIHNSLLGEKNQGPVTWTKTSTQTQVSSTPTETSPLWTATPQSIPCYRARVLHESPPPYYDQLLPEEHFIKTWTLLNTGSCAWPANVKVVYVRVEKNKTADILDQMSGPEEQPIQQEVLVGGTIDVRIALRSPALPGQYAGYWMLKNTAGGRFGEGLRGEAAFSVSIIIQLWRPTWTSQLVIPSSSPINTKTQIVPTETEIPVTVVPPTDTLTYTPTGLLTNTTEGL